MVSAQGPASSVTRHILLTLAIHADRYLKCFPTIKLIAREAAVSERTVCTHLEKAVAEGWLKRSYRGNGKQWKNYVYTLTVPAHAAEGHSAASVSDGAERGSVGSRNNKQCGDGAESGATGLELDAHAAAAGGALVLKEVLSNMAFNKSFKSESNRIEVATNDESPGRVKDVKQWAKELNIMEIPGEHPGAFQVRVAEAAAKHKARAA